MSAIYFLDKKGHVLINFDYRGEVDLSIPDKFMAYIQQNDRILPNPVFQIDDWCFAYICRSSLYFLVVTCINSNIALLLSFLSSLTNLFQSYPTKLTEEEIIDNFSLVYELLDEVIDFGYPQITDHKVLNQYILRSKPKDLKMQQDHVQIDLTGIITWRKADIMYPVNEVFVNVVEKMNMLVAKNGSVIHNEIVGEKNMTT